MPRPPRIEIPNGVYHVASRGVARSPIVAADVDRVIFRHLLHQTVARFEWTCHAWCLMTNHYHLVLQLKQPNLSRGMQRLNGAYAQDFNKRHGRVGHLFQGRFWAQLIETDEQLSAVCLYVVTNPVRAGLCEDVTAWPWSGARFSIRDSV